MKTFKFAYVHYVWVEMLKKMAHTSQSAFDHFTGRPQGLCLIVAVIFFLFGMFFMIYSWLMLLGGYKVELLNMFSMLIPMLNAIST